MVDRTLALAQRLSLLPSITKWDTPGEPQAHTMALGLHDVEQSCRRLVEELLPALRAGPPDAEALNDTLLDVGEELRHIYYHAKDIKFFAYLTE
jgi:hypothetical protein